jgi:predicted DNA-binding transcriptional regulator YafY
MARTGRLHWIDAQICAGRFPTPEDVQAEFGVSRRTVFDDLHHLRHEIGAPIVHDRAGGGWSYSDPTFRLTALILTDQETVTLHRALLAAREHLDPGAQTGLDAFADWLEQNGLPPPATPAESAGGGSHLLAGVTVPADLMVACQRAVRNRRKLFFRYHGAHQGEVTERTIQPHHLHHWRGEPYLLAWDEL